MDQVTQLALIDRIHAHRAAGRGTDTAATAWRRSIDAYTCLDRLAAERALLRKTPTIVGLSAMVPEPRSFAATRVGDIPVVVTRGDDGAVSAMINLCRHRGAEVATGCGNAARLTCSYHGWTYGLDGSLAARRRPEYFADEPDDGLVRLPVLEQDGLIWVHGDPNGSIPEQPLAGAEREIGPLGLESHRLFTSSTFTRAINWKLVMDTFLEVYHVPVLHRVSLGEMISGDYSLFDSFGDHGRMVVTRTSIPELDKQDRAEWDLYPHATIVWMLVPNTVLIYQQDHAQLYQAWPGRTADESEITVSLWVPDDSPVADDHWQKNFDLLIKVTDTEDFVTCAGMQQGFNAGGFQSVDQGLNGDSAEPHIMFGRNEPTLQHFHRSIEALLATR